VPLATAKKKLVQGQVVFLETLAKKLGINLDGPAVTGPSQASLF
jgi:predicted NUDIX family NTP pyrophosphohydrolase